ncbi:MAG: M3 family metallopeptidase [Culicoidibacterales bacterium]
MQNYLWNLSHLYSDLNDPKLISDIETTFDSLESFLQWCDAAFQNNTDAVNTIHLYFKKQNETYSQVAKLIAYPELISSVDTANNDAESLLSSLYSRLADYYAIAVKFSKYIALLPEKDAVFNQLPDTYKSLCLDIVENSKYLLSENEEVLIAKLRSSGSEAWQTLYGKLTSQLTFSIELDGVMQTFPLSSANKYLQSDDAAIRKATYNAVADSRLTIAPILAQTLRSIKTESITTNQLRGYDSIIQEVVLSSKMTEKTLDSLWTAVEKNVALIQRFFKAKAKKLGTTALKPYDLTAPIGKSETTYSVEDAQNIILNCFGKFSDNKKTVATRAFNESWVDYLPRENKRSGAFCYSVHNANLSYIMMNYNGNIGDIITLAHELGHAYHGQVLSSGEYTLSRYSLPLAETASNLAERIVKDELLKTATDSEKLEILDSTLLDFSISTLIIYLRFRFEKEIIERYQNGDVLEAETLSQIEIDLYKEYLGDSFDHAENKGTNWIAILHHFYHDYYNFPYAFGLLYSAGLYEKYQENPSDFIQQYDDMLILTGYKNACDVASSMNVDLEAFDFWNTSMKSFESMLETYEQL